MAILVSGIELITTTSEIVGYKSGLALTREHLIRLTPAYYARIWDGPDERIVRIRSEEFEEIIANILYKTGNTSTPSTMPLGVAGYHKYKGDPKLLSIWMDVTSLFTEMLRKGLEDEGTTGNKTIDPTPFVEACRERHANIGANMAVEILKGLDYQQHRSPWMPYRRIEWKDTANLNDLFRSESLETYYGSFLDQRFIDYLSRNYDDIDQINWRKFEALTAEFFDRLGFRVEIGKGRNDDNIDVRVWPTAEAKNHPPALLVQCKRQKREVEKVVVKALWADISHEGAKSGLIVTTSALSPGAEKVCTARSYPIEQANRKTLVTWVQAMRSPGSGIIFGE